MICCYWRLWNSVIALLQKLPNAALTNLKYDVLRLLLLTLPHSNLFFFFWYLSFLENEDVEAQRISSSLGVSHCQMKRSWTGLSWTQPQQSVEGFHTAMKENTNRISPCGAKRGRYCFVRRMKEKMALKYTDKLKRAETPGATPKKPTHAGYRSSLFLEEKKTPTVTQVKADMSQGH